jgi:hypothetical protein
MNEPQISKSVQSAADLAMSYFYKFKNENLDLNALSPEEFSSLSYSIKHGDQALNFQKNPDLHRFKLEILAYRPKM